MWRLLYPLRYFRLQNSEKRHLDAWPTLIIAALIAAPYLLVPTASFFEGGGFLDKLLALTSALTGFYVAALVGAATFSHPDLDRTIAVGAVALVRRGDDGKQIQELLTRRQFACAVFGYLSFATLFVSLFAGVAIPLSEVPQTTLQALPIVGLLFDLPYFLYLRGALIIVFSLAIAHVAVVTSLGLYYLMDRLYRREPKVTTRKPDQSNEAA